MTVAACGSKYLRTPSDETSFLTWQISRQTVDYAEAWMLLPALFESFSERSPLRLGLTEKKKVTYLKVSIKFRISRTLLQLATMAKLRRWLLQCTKNFALGSFEVTLAWTPYTCPLIVEALSYPLPRHLLESKPHCSTLSTRKITNGSTQWVQQD